VNLGEPNNASYSVSTPLSDLEKFEQGTIWKDILSVYGNVLIGIRDRLELIGADTGVPASDMPYVTEYLQGKAAQVRADMEVIQTLLKIKQEEKEDGTNKDR